MIAIIAMVPNHLAKECMLQNKEEKKERVKDEAYYAGKIEELKARTKGVTTHSFGSIKVNEIHTSSIKAYIRSNNELH